MRARFMGWCLAGLTDEIEHRRLLTFGNQGPMIVDIDYSAAPASRLSPHLTIEPARMRVRGPGAAKDVCVILWAPEVRMTAAFARTRLAQR